MTAPERAEQMAKEITNSCKHELFISDTSVSRIGACYRCLTSALEAYGDEKLEEAVKEIDTFCGCGLNGRHSSAKILVETVRSLKSKKGEA